VVEINNDMPYISDMNDFLRGMTSVGQLVPDPAPSSDCPAKNSAWQGVANSFYQAGNNIRVAIKEFTGAQRKSKQTS
jgi:hypothetical protein